MPWPENTHHKTMYHCTADLLFDWFGFDRTSETVVHQHKQSSGIKQEVGRTVILLPLKVSILCLGGLRLVIILRPKVTVNKSSRYF